MKKIKYEDLMVKLFGWSRTTYYTWKKEQWEKGSRPILALLEKYFTEEDLIEWIEHEKISKFEKLVNPDQAQEKINEEIFKRLEKLEDDS